MSRSADRAAWIAAGGLLLLLVGSGLWLFRQELFGPAAPPQPAPGPGGNTITFGRGLNPDGTAVIDPTTRFTADDGVAWVARFEHGVGAEQVMVALYEVAADGTEAVLDRNVMTVEDPNWKVIYNFTQARAFLEMSKQPGASRTFRIKYITNGVLAQGDFVIQAE